MFGLLFELFIDELTVMGVGIIFGLALLFVLLPLPLPLLLLLLLLPLMLTVLLLLLLLLTVLVLLIVLALLILEEFGVSGIEGGLLYPGSIKLNGVLNSIDYCR